MYTTPDELNGRPHVPSVPAPSVSRAAAPAPTESQPTSLGTLRIARRVLRTVVETAARSIPGVAGLAQGASPWPTAFGHVLPRHGIGLSLHGDILAVDVYVILEPGANMIEVGSRVQEAIGAAVEHILGMRAGEINVYIQDVA